MVSRKTTRRLHVPIALARRGSLTLPESFPVLGSPEATKAEDQADASLGEGQYVTLGAQTTRRQLRQALTRNSSTQSKIQAEAAEAESEVATY